MDKTWSVVKFTGENTVEAVPTNWLLGQMCYWPPYTKEKLIQAIRRQEPPNTCWPLHKIEIFRNAVYNDYSVARFKCKTAEDHSDLNSDMEDSKLRKVRKKKQIADSSSDESDGRYSHPTGGLPLPPAFKDTAEYAEDTGIIRTNNILPVLQHAEQQPENSSVGGTHCCTCLKNDGLLKRIFKQQALIKNIVTDVLEEIKKINMRPVSKDEESGSIFQLFENFPINSDEEMKEFETLLEEKTTFDCAVKEFSKVGGSTLYDFIKRCLNQMITNKYADEYSWLGAKKKKIFGSTKLAEVLLVAADKSNLSTDRKATETAIKNWLRRAKERTLASEKKSEPLI